LAARASGSATGACSVSSLWVAPLSKTVISPANQLLCISGQSAAESSRAPGAKKELMAAQSAGL
jgi:hypothetical protein